MDVFKLSRDWFDFSFENPEKIKPNHAALYFFIIEHCNRLGWKGKFGLPTTMAKEAIGISSYNTYINTLRDLCDWGFIKMIEKSKNQYSSNIIAISNFDKALDKALDKAMIKHDTKHVSKQSESIDSIDIQETLIQETINKKQLKEDFDFFRKNYLGTKNGLDVEFKNFISKNNYEDIPLLLPAFEIEKKHKDLLKLKNEFCPQWKNLKTWVNQKCWLQEFPEIKSGAIEKPDNSKYSPEEMADFEKRFKANTY